LKVEYTSTQRLHFSRCQFVRSMQLSWQRTTRPLMHLSPVYPGRRVVLRECIIAEFILGRGNLPQDGKLILTRVPLKEESFKIYPSISSLKRRQMRQETLLTLHEAIKSARLVRLFSYHVQIFAFLYYL